MEIKTRREIRALVGISIFCLVTGMIMHILRTSDVALASLISQQDAQAEVENDAEVLQAIERMENMIQGLYAEQEQACMYQE